MQDKRENRQADFEVHYRFYTADEGGRQTGPPLQGYRPDWAYDGDDISRTGIYMVWPEFISPDGLVLPQGVQVPASGVARMWIITPAMRAQKHQTQIRDGVRGYFMEGAHRVAEAVVTRVMGLHRNATPGATHVV